MRLSGFNFFGKQIGRCNVTYKRRGLLPNYFGQLVLLLVNVLVCFVNAENNTCVEKASLTALLDELVQSHDTAVSNTTNWDLFSSVFFAATVVSTIGINMLPTVHSRFDFRLPSSSQTIPMRR